VSLEIGISLVCPVYCSAQTLRILVDEICTCLNSTHKFEILLIDDRSPDSSWLEILQISKENSTVRGIRLGRNVGQHGALLAGIRSARFDKIVTIDDDLQNPPSEVIKLVQALDSNGGVVYGVSADVKQKLWRKASSTGAKQLFKKFLGFDSAVKISSFRAFETNLRNAFSGEIGPSVSIDSLLTWSTSTFCSIDVQHHPRLQGKSHYSFRKLVRFMIDTATGYSVVPLRLATTLGSIVTILGFVMFLWVTLRPLLTGVSVPGFPLLAASLAIFSGTQLLVLGILGEYIGKMHFRVMNKPSYVIVDSSEYN
jgi:undecaprenyl-phosphate 4-deoxy-4-formamido-L-arabinose transferase